MRLYAAIATVLGVLFAGAWLNVRMQLEQTRTISEELRATLSMIRSAVGDEGAELRSAIDTCLEEQEENRELGLRSAGRNAVKIELAYITAQQRCSECLRSVVESHESDVDFYLGHSEQGSE